MFKIWCIEKGEKRVLVRDDVIDPTHVRRLVEQGNCGAQIRGEGHRYVAEPDPDKMPISTDEDESCERSLRLVTNSEPEVHVGE